MTGENKFNFEQIPVETVRKIAQDLPPAAPGTTEPGKSREDSETATDWKTLALQVQQEEDPKRMIQIVEQLILTLDRDRNRTYQMTSAAHIPAAWAGDKRQSQHCANESNANRE
jgi:hypothetical protein